jgi:hypothetical protein
MILTYYALEVAKLLRKQKIKCDRLPLIAANWPKTTQIK